MRELYDDLANCANRYGVFGKMSIYHEVVLVRWLPDGGDEYLQLNGRLFAGVTRPIAKFELISSWNSNAEVRDALHGSMHIPFYMSHVEPVGSGWAIDGGFTCNSARIDERTVTIGVDRTTLDICPAVPFGPSIVFVPASSAAERDRLQACGRADALEHLKNGRGAAQAAIAASWRGYNERETPIAFAVVGWAFRYLEENFTIAAVAAGAGAVLYRFIYTKNLFKSLSRLIPVSV